MNLTGKIMQFIGFARRDERPNPDPIRGDIVRAVQRNEQASYKAQQALADLLTDKSKMPDTIRNIVGKM